ncbi:MAG: SGNH/GDSL hydrolase family protein [Alphaproteobacteria bacterium]|nr:SGNH/GDSL hydrolase family protein [Alphaproteobacteria bacterium]
MTHFAVYKTHYRRQPFTYHPQLGWWHLPDFYARLALGQTYHVFETNRHGMRDGVSHTHSKEQVGSRLTFLGDSYTAGDGVNNHERFSDIMAGHMPSRPAVMNFGLNSSGTDQQLLIAEHLALAFETDAIIWGICVENIARNLCNCRPSWDFSQHRTVYRPKPRFVLENGELVADGSVLTNHSLLKDDITSGRWIDHPHHYLPDGMGVYDLYRADAAEPWQLMKAIIQRLIKRAAGIPVMLVPLPMVDHYEGRAEPYYMDRFSELHAPENKVFVVDVLPALRAAPASQKAAFRFPDDPHYTPAAHRLVGQVLAHECQRLLPELYFGRRQ